MKIDIKCETCNQVLIVVEADALSEADRAEYVANTVCDQGHTPVAVEAQPE